MTVVTVPPTNLVEEQHTGLVVAQDFDAMVVSADNPATVVISPSPTDTASIASVYAAYVPTFRWTTVGGTPATFAVNAARWTQIGKTVHFNITATMSNVGVGNGGLLLFTLPVPMPATAMIFGSGREVALIGKMLAVTGNVNPNEAYLTNYDGSTVVTTGNGAIFIFGGIYEAA